MITFEYEITDNGYCVKTPHSEYEVLELIGFEPELTRRYKGLVAQKNDLDRAKACLEQMLFNVDTSLIDGALMNTAIQLLVRCFTKSNTADRLKFDEYKVFKKYAKEIGESDLHNTYMQFYQARNKVISHDELNYSHNIVGLTVTPDKTACDVTYLAVSTRYVYKKNKDLLLRLINISSRYCDAQILDVGNLLVEKYNLAQPKPNLARIDRARLEEFESFNAW